MYLVSTVDSSDIHFITKVKDKPPSGPGFTEEQALKADRLECWGTSFSDPGPDYCEFRLFAGSELIETRRVEGY